MRAMGFSDYTKRYTLPLSYLVEHATLSATIIADVITR